MEISKLIITEEQWGQMSDEERLRAVREGKLSTVQMRKLLKEGPDDLKQAVEEYLADPANRPQPLAGIFKQFRTPSLSERFAELVKPTSIALPEVEIPRWQLATPEETHGYESARTLINRLQTRYKLWVEQLPDDVQPAIYAILSNGVVMKALDFEEDGHNGVAIYGEVEGVPARCLLITHQAGLQLLCVGEPVEQKSVRPIGFHTSARPSEPQTKS